MSDSEDLLQFQRFMAATGPEGEDPLIAFLPPEEAYVARVCAIPHEFDAATIRAAIPDVPPETVAKTVEALSTSATVTPTASGFTMHDAVRHRLFATWFRKPEFAAINRRLADYYAHLVDAQTNGRRAVLERRRVFHLIGADPEQGLNAVIRLCAAARERFEFANCSSMLGLAHEYDSVLAAAERVALHYEEGKIAADLGNWRRATDLLRGIIDDSAAPAEFRVRALNRLGLVDDAQHHFELALDDFTAALKLATAAGIRKEIPAIAINISNALRDLGRIDDALKHLTTAIHEAELLGDEDAVAAARNAAGLIHYRRGEYEKAIANFSDVTSILFRRDRVVPLAGVQANLGLAYAGALRWTDSEAAFRKSLSVYQALGTSEPYARALSGLARTVFAQQRIEEALQIASAAEKAFADTHPLEAGTTARDCGRWLVAAERPDNARQRFRAAIDYFRTAGAATEVAVTERELSAVGGTTLPPVVRGCLWAVAIVGGLIVLIVILALVFDPN